VEVWFNPSCSKCRTARDHLEEAGVEYTLRRYLDDPPSEAELRAALGALGLQPWDVTRMSEPLARELGLADLPRDADTWIGLLVQHPRLLQRPIVLTDDGRAWVARDDRTLGEVLTAARDAGERP
jgi:arsenate reductase (glutaredoxin)